MKQIVNSKCIYIHKHKLTKKKKSEKWEITILRFYVRGARYF